MRTHNGMGDEQVEAEIGSFEDLDLTIRARVRDNRRDEAFHLLRDTYKERLHKLCQSFLKEPMLAEDALQESLFLIWQKLHQYGGRAPLLHWLSRITSNCCRARLKQHRKLVPMDDINVEASMRDGRELDDPSYTEDNALCIDIRNIVDGSPERHRCVLTLFYYEGRSVEGVAQTLGVPEGTVKARLFRARKYVDKKLRRLGVDRLEGWLGEDP